MRVILIAAGLMVLSSAAEPREPADAIMDVSKQSAQFVYNIASIGKAMAENGIEQAAVGAQPPGGFRNYVATTDCLEELSDAATTAENSMQDLWTSVTLSNLATVPEDRVNADALSGISIKSAMNGLGIQRDGINHALAQCAQSVLINQKAQELQTIVNEEEKVLDQVSTQLGHSHHAGRK
jgi:hypothetical protein